MNKENMLKIADVIEKHEIAKLDMNNFVFEYDSCGTSACVCGFAALTVYPNDTRERIYNIEGSFIDFGKRYFDITEEQSDMLFASESQDIINFVNNNRDYVPAAMRWMAANDTIDWYKAMEAVKGDK